MPVTLRRRYVMMTGAWRVAQPKADPQAKR